MRPLGKKITTTMRKSPRKIRRKGGPTLLTPGKIGLRGCKYLSVRGRNESIETRMIEPMRGPSIVPKPPMTAMMSGRKL